MNAEDVGGGQDFCIGSTVVSVCSTFVVLANPFEQALIKCSKQTMQRAKGAECIGQNAVSESIVYTFTTIAIR